MASCNGCEKQWTSLSWAHCGACHETFVGITYFDYHRSGGDCWQQKTSYTGYTYTKQLGNGEFGQWTLVKDDGVWATQEGHDRLHSNNEHMAMMRRVRDAGS